MAALEFSSQGLFLAEPNQKQSGLWILHSTGTELTITGSGKKMWLLPCKVPIFHTRCSHSSETDRSHRSTGPDAAADSSQAELLAACLAAAALAPNLEPLWGLCSSMTMAITIQERDGTEELLQRTGRTWGLGCYQEKGGAAGLPPVSLLTQVRRQVSGAACLPQGNSGL